MGAVENEIPVVVGSDDDGITLHALLPDLLPDASETGGIVGLVQDQAGKLENRRSLSVGITAYTGSCVARYAGRGTPATRLPRSG